MNTNQRYTQPTTNNPSAVGVIVGRFQIHDLHDGHKKLIEGVMKNHKKVLLFLGISRTMVTQKNPLDFVTRKKMIEQHFPEITILSIQDQNNDEVWSKILDSRIDEVYPIDDVVLYGSRDSFIKRYYGKYECVELEQEVFISGTEVRKNISSDIKSSPDFRSGVIWSTYNKYPTAFATVDVAIIKDGKLLLAKKPNEDKYRFVGGFVDPSDENLEHAARREISEELGSNIEIGGFEYVCSHRVDDWRYRGEVDKIITTLFKAEQVYGSPNPSDDISECRYFDLDEIKVDDVMEEHKFLLMSFLSSMDTFQDIRASKD